MSSALTFTLEQIILFTKHEFHYKISLQTDTVNITCI